MGGDDRVGHAAVGGEHDRADRALALGAEHDGAGAVAEDRGGALVVGVGDAAEDLGADHEHGSARPVSIWPAPAESAASQPVQAEPTS